MRGVLSARIAKLLRLDTFGMLLFVLRRRIVAMFAIAALQRDDFSHDLIPFSNSRASVLQSRKSQTTR
jgi:hypothetical protein